VAESNGNNRISLPGVRTSLADLVGRLGSSARDLISGRDFNPGKPLPPAGTPQEKHDGPRYWQYPTSSNLTYQPRGENTQLTPFEQLRNLARLYDVASIGISSNIKDMCEVEWSIVAKDKAKQEAYEQAGVIGAVTEFWKHPDRLDDFSSWLAKALRDVYEIDALSLYVRRNRGGGLYGVEVVDGSTIKPIIDDRGRALAYQQILWGYPRSQYLRFGVDAVDEMLQLQGETSTGGEIIYRPRNPRTDSPYGMSPLEWVIMRVNMALRKQSFDLAWFTEGNIPEMFASPPDAELSPQKVYEFEGWFNSVLAGNDKERRRIRFLPWKLNLQPTKEWSGNPEWDSWLMKMTLAALDVMPSELGFVEDVNRATAQSQQKTQTRKGVSSVAKWLKGTFDTIIQHPNGLNQTGLEWKWHIDDPVDTKAQAEEDKIYTEMGALTADEVRTLRFSHLVKNNPLAARPPAAAPTPGNQPVQEHPGDQSQKLAKSVVLPPGEPTQPKHTGVMIAFRIPHDVAHHLCSIMAAAGIPEPEDLEDLHITLAYLGDMERDGLDASLNKLVDAAMSDFATTAAPLSGEISGLGLFNPPATMGPDAKRVLYASFDSPALPKFRETLIDLLTFKGVAVKQNHGFTPHITLAYLPPETASLPVIDLPNLPITFREVIVKFGDVAQTYLIPNFDNNGDGVNDTPTQVSDAIGG
jgi:2'-5' RNA ligase